MYMYFKHEFKYGYSKYCYILWCLLHTQCALYHNDIIMMSHVDTPQDITSHANKESP